MRGSQHPTWSQACASFKHLPLTQARVSCPTRTAQPRPQSSQGRGELPAPWATSLVGLGRPQWPPQIKAP